MTVAELVGRALAELSQAHVAVAEFTISEPTLDEVFLALTGHPAETAESPEEDAA